MTYCPPDHSFQTYEFTALSGADILGLGNENLGCGESFVMPESATATFTVTDNDGVLSGDAWCNEYGDDHVGQLADIVSDGALVYDDVKIYAEEIYVLRDQDGNTYYMIEIELVGSESGDRDDFFTFFGATPPAGSELTVTARHNVCGSWVDYNALSAGTVLDFTAGNTFTIAGPVETEVSITELDGELVFTVRVPDGSGTIGDLRGFFFDVTDESLIDGLVLSSGAQVTEARFLEDRVSNLGKGANVNGEIVNTGGKFDAGIEIGTAGMSADDIQETSFRIAHTDQPLDVSIFAGARFAVRYTSVGEEDGSRDDSTKSVGFMQSPPEALDDLGETDEDTIYTQDLLANDSDPDGDSLTVVSAGGLAPGSPITVTSENGRTTTVFVSAAGVLTLDPTVDFNDLPLGATDRITVSYEITDGNGNFDTAQATVIINGLNDAPVAVDDFYQVSETDPAVLDILTNDFDPDGDTFTFEILTQPIEGEVSVDANGDVVFNPGDAFATLSEGQTATVTFDYEIFDGQLRDTAVVTIEVQGEGITDPMPMTMTELASTPAGDFTVQTVAPKKTTDGTADFSFSVSLGDFETEVYNIYYVVDVSGSTSETAGFGDVETVLEAEVAALQGLTDTFMEFGIPDGNLTITVLPFNSRAAPTEPVEVFNEETGEFDLTSFPIETFGDNEQISALDINTSLGALEPGGETSYLSAIFAAAGTAQQLDPFNQENNIFYFVSDGDPFPITPNTEAQIDQFSSLFLHPRGDVHAIAVGDVIDTQYIDGVDNTDGVAEVTNSEELAAAVLENSNDPGVILSASLEVFNSSGTLVDTLVFTGADFSDTPLGFRLDVEDVGGFDPLVGQTNTAVMTIEIDGDQDGTADEVLTQTVEIDGVLPVSFDF